MTTDSTAGTPAVGTATQINLGADTAPLQAALASLEAVFKTTPEFSQNFLDDRNIFVEDYRIDGACGAARGAGDIRIIFQPTDHLCDLLLATGAGDLQ